MSDSESSKRQKRVLFSIWGIAIGFVLLREPIWQLIHYLLTL